MLESCGWIFKHSSAHFSALNFATELLLPQGPLLGQADPSSGEAVQWNLRVSHLPAPSGEAGPILPYSFVMHS